MIYDPDPDALHLTCILYYLHSKPTLHWKCILLFKCILRPICTLHKTLSRTPIMASYLKANIRFCHFQEKMKSIFQNFHKLWVCLQIFKKENHSAGLDVRVFYFTCFQIILKKVKWELAQFTNWLLLWNFDFWPSEICE